MSKLSSGLAAGAAYMSLGTFRKNGTRVAVPVWFAASNGRYYVFTESKAYKVKRLRRDPRVEVAVCDIRGRVSGPWQSGSGRVMDTDSAADAARIQSAYAALRTKYGWQMWIADSVSRLNGRYNKRAMLELQIEDPVRHSP